MAKARRLRAWLKREREEWKGGTFPSWRIERFHRRRRICDYLLEPDFVEALRELEAFAKEIGS